ncbi:MAG TPA: hypothetical protein DDY39_15575, partial [Nitrospira sp.]|nr:hypothetical protein [Nitrospira sp.]
GNGEKSEVDARVNILRAQIEETTSDYDREKRWRCINCGWYCEESVVLRSLVVRLSTSSC